MARRLLSQTVARTTLGFAGAIVLAACPHDWAAFEEVSRTAAVVDAGALDVVVDVPAPVVPAFATLGEKPALIAADETGIVFTTLEGSVLSCGHGGCNPAATIAGAQKDVRALAIGFGFVAWAARGDHTVRRTGRTPGQGAMEQVYDDDGLLAVGLSRDHVYFAVDAVGAIIPAPGIRYCTPGVDCKNFTFASFADGDVTDLVMDGTDAFWLAEGKVFGCRVADCDEDMNRRVEISSEVSGVSGIALDAEYVYWASPADGGSVRGAPRSALATPGSGGARAIAIGVGSIGRLAPSNGSVWFTSGVAGTVSRAPREGGKAEIVATGLAAPAGIAAAAGHVYVTCSGDGRIMRFGG